MGSHGKRHASSHWQWCYVCSTSAGSESRVCTGKVPRRSTQAGKRTEGHVQDPERPLVAPQKSIACYPPRITAACMFEGCPDSQTQDLKILGEYQLSRSQSGTRLACQLSHGAILSVSRQISLLPVDLSAFAVRRFHLITLKLFSPTRRPRCRCGRPARHREAMSVSRLLCACSVRPCGAYTEARRG